GGPVPDLVGWLEPAGEPAPRPVDDLGSTGHTAAVLAGEHLRVGDIGALDGYVEDLTITAVAPEGFWGWWRAFPGWEVTVDSATGRVLPDPAGYFCALRRDSAR
ncbi:MAG TPA: hypothetical protein VFU40_08460, partial [Gemmatimonadales bacterium]|nr:hypothetical protein [Gemmatimonadales bacterium]